VKGRVEKTRKDAPLVNQESLLGHAMSTLRKKETLTDNFVV